MNFAAEVYKASKDLDGDFDPCTNIDEIRSSDVVEAATFLSCVLQVEESRQYLCELVEGIIK